MIAAAFLYVDLAKGMYRYRPLRPEIHCLWLLAWLKPEGHGKPPLIGPITNGIGPLRRKWAIALGTTADTGKSRSTISNSPALIRVRICFQVCNSRAMA